MARLGLYELRPHRRGRGPAQNSNTRRHPLATQEHGRDAEDIEEADREAGEDEEED